MDPVTNIVVLWGGALLACNLIFDPTFSTLKTAALSGKQGAIASAVKADKGSTNTGVTGALTSPTEVVVVGLLTLVGMSFASNASAKAGKAMLWALGGLTILWLINYQEMKGSAGTPAPVTTNTSGNSSGSGGGYAPTTSGGKTQTQTNPTPAQSYRHQLTGLN